MSGLIKRMEMQKDCISCEFSYLMFEGIWYCGYTGKYIDEKNDEEYYEASYSYDCPLVEVPTPHGQLIDADDVKSRMIPLSFSVQKWISEVELSNCKTVIEAERE